MRYHARDDKGLGGMRRSQMEVHGMPRKPLKRKSKPARKAKRAAPLAHGAKSAARGSRKAKPATRKKSAQRAASTRPAKPAKRAKIAAKASPSRTPDDLHALAAVGIAMLDLPVEPAWHEAIVFNLQLLFKHATFVDAFALTDETESGPVFRA
jgi:hypothetical protein